MNEVLQTRKDEGTLYIAEGLLMYLSEEDVKSIFKMMTCISPDKRKIIFSYRTPSSNDKWTLVNYWLALKKENLLWNIPEKDLTEFLKDFYPIIKKTVTPADLQNLINKSKTDKVNRVLGENICVATM